MCIRTLDLEGLDNLPSVNSSPHLPYFTDSLKMLQISCPSSSSSSSLPGISTLPLTPSFARSFETTQFSSSSNHPNQGTTDYYITLLTTGTATKRKRAASLRTSSSSSCFDGLYRQRRTSTSTTDVKKLTELSTREIRALRRKEKSRLAAKVRRHQENSILSHLLNALPVVLDIHPAPPSTSSSSSVNLEKSGVIRIAGQTLFLYNCFAHLLGTDSTPMISLLSHAAFGLLVQPSDLTIVYATPPLAEALGWPWINLIGACVEDILEPKQNGESGVLPTASGQTVRFRILEPTSPTKSSFHRINHENPSLWSPHLYRSSKADPQMQSIVSNHLNRKRSSLLCSCYIVAQIPMAGRPLSPGHPQQSNVSTNEEEERRELSFPSPPPENLMLYLLQPALFPSNPLDTSAAKSQSPNSSCLSQDRDVFCRQERDVFCRQRLKSIPCNLQQHQTAFALSCQNISTREHFFTYLDSNLCVKSVHSNFDSLNASAAVGHFFLDLVHLDDLTRISSLLGSCIQNNSEVWSQAYRFRMPMRNCRLKGDQPDSNLIWVRTLFSKRPNADRSLSGTIKCMHQPISCVGKSSSASEFYAIKQGLLSNLSPPLLIIPSQQMASTRLHQRQQQPQQPILFQPRFKLEKKAPLITASRSAPPASTLIQSCRQTHCRPIRLLQLQQNASQVSQTAAIAGEMNGRLRSNTQSIVKSNYVCSPSFVQRWPIFTRTLTSPSEPPVLKREESLQSLCLVTSPSSSPMSRVKCPKLESVLDALDSAQPGVSLNEMLQSLGPDMLSLIDEERHDTNSGPHLNLSDILFPQSRSCNGEGEMKGEYESEESGLGSLSSSSPTSLISPTSEAGMMQFSDSETGLDPEILSDSDEFWDVLVSNVMSLPLDFESFQPDVR